MSANTARKYREIIDYVEDQVGADINRDLMRIAITATDVTTLPISTPSGETITAVLEGEDDDGNTVTPKHEQLDQGVAASTVAQITYLARALNDIGQDELVARLSDTAGNQVEPDQAPDYVNNLLSQDLVGTGDLTFGPVSVERSQGIIISGNSTHSNSWDASVTWYGPNGSEEVEAQTASDIGLKDAVEDSARLSRKGAQVEVVFTDTSNGAQNTINAYVDVHR